MKINKFKINGFGKLKDKEISLTDGINVIYGHNESGKSSLLKFISCMFYGASKNKNGKDITDFDKYMPWNQDEYSGKIEYSLDNNESFEVFRDFKKKNPIIYNEKKEDISKKFNNDKTKGILFFEDQTGIDETTFFNTAITEQEGIKLSKNSQLDIVQKISNLVSTGNDNISYKKTVEKISKELNDVVGTERTSQKPINVVNKKMEKLLAEKKELDAFKDSNKLNSEEIEKLEKEIDSNEAKKDFLKNLRNKKYELLSLENQIAFLNENLKAILKDINDVSLKIENPNTNKKSRKSIKLYIVLNIVIALVFIATFIITKFNLLSLLVIIPLIITMILLIIRIVDNKKIDEINSITETDLKNKLDILNKNYETTKNEVTNNETMLYNQEDKIKEDLFNEYSNFIEMDFFDYAFDLNYDKLVKEIDSIENNLSNLKVKFQNIDQENKRILLKFENLVSIEENIESLEEEKKELLSLANSYKIAKDSMIEAYEKVKENISPKFIENLSDVISKISNNKYTNCILQDDDGILAEVQDGRYMPISRLSTGTIDQMYLSLRLSALNEISKETMPIILDEAFAYFDNERLSNILKYLKTNFSDSQIIIFTCSDREKEVLRELNIEYNLISLEN